jgi:hypothetical protein
MTATRPSDRLATAPFTPTGHPIRWFSIAIALLAIALVTSWWAAILNPRLSIAATQGDWDVGTLHGSWSVTMHNDAPTPIEIESASVIGPGLTTGEVLVDGRSLDGQRRVAGGADFVVTVTYSAEGCTPIGAGEPAHIVVTARTIIGIERGYRPPLGGFHVPTSCPAP